MDDEAEPSLLPIVRIPAVRGRYPDHSTALHCTAGTVQCTVLHCMAGTVQCTVLHCMAGTVQCTVQESRAV